MQTQVVADVHAVGLAEKKETPRGGVDDELLAAARACRPDVALVDIEMPGGDGISAAAALGEALPQCRTLIRRRSSTLRR